MQILVIEDNVSSLKMLTFVLENEGHSVHGAATGARGLEVLRREAIDVLILDVLLPDGNGLQVCRAVRREDPHMPILIVSALAAKADKLAALDGGADDYLTKPFDPAEVVARVHSLARRTQVVLAPELQTRLCIGPICLDVRHQRVELRPSGKQLPLTYMEAQLLHVLMRNAGQVVTHERLIAEAWGSSYAGSSNQLEVYVHRLRRKLRREVGALEVIRTAPGSGYEIPAHMPQAS